MDKPDYYEVLGIGRDACPVEIKSAFRREASLLKSGRSIDIVEVGLVKKSKLKFMTDSVLLLLMLSIVSTGFIIRYILPPGSGGHSGGRALNLWGMNRHNWGDVHFWLAALLIGMLVVHLVLNWSWVCGVVRRWIGSDRGASGKFSPGTLMTSGAGIFLLNVVLVGGFVWLSGSSVVATMPGDGDIHQGVIMESNRQEIRISELSKREKTDQPQELGDLNENNKHKVQPVGRGQEGPDHGLGFGKGLARGKKGVGRRIRGVGVRQVKESYFQQKSEGLGEDDCKKIRGYMTLKEVATSAGVPVGKIKSLVGLPNSVSQDEHLGRLRRSYGFQLDEVRKLIANFKSGKTNLPARNVSQ